MPRYRPSDFVDPDDVRAERARSPHARQLCAGSLRQVQDVVVSAIDKVPCPECGRSLVVDSCVPDRDEDGRRVLRAVVASHMPDQAGLQRTAERRLVRERSSTPRPF